MFILVGATVFSFTFNAADGHVWVEHLFQKLPGGQLGFLLAVNLLGARGGRRTPETPARPRDSREGSSAHLAWISWARIAAAVPRSTCRYAAT